MLRISYLDNLKALAIILVVVVHTAVTYSGNGAWFYVEHRLLSDFAFYFFAFLLSFSQAFFMALLFAIGGYFVPSSLEKKGTKRFIASRTYRLGMPALVFALLIFPICEALSVPGYTFGRYFHGVIAFQFVGWTGPLWFTVALLILTLFYLAIKKGCDAFAAKYEFTITVKNVLILVALIGMGAFVLRLFFPLNKTYLDFELSNFSAYIFLFLLGVFAKQKGIFDRIEYRQAKKWLIASFAVGVPWWILIALFGITGHGEQRDVSSIMGGAHWASFVFALWESFFCVTFILALIGIFRERFNTQNPLQKFLSTNAFAVYVFHPPVLIGVALLLKGFEWPVLLKFALVSLIVLPIAFIVAYLLRNIPPIRKLFS